MRLTRLFKHFSSSVLKENVEFSMSFSRLRWLWINRLFTQFLKLSRGEIVLSPVQGQLSSVRKNVKDIVPALSDNVTRLQSEWPLMHGRKGVKEFMLRENVVTTGMVMVQHPVCAKLRNVNGVGGCTMYFGKRRFSTASSPPSSFVRRGEYDHEVIVGDVQDDSLTGQEESLRAESKTAQDQTDVSHSGVEVMIRNKDLPEMSRKVFNLAPYVTRSETLQKLVKLGVNLAKVEKVMGMASLLLMSDFDKDILPYLRHLIRVGVQPDKLGYILTINPKMLTEYIDHLEERVGYLLSKEFSIQEVASMYTRAPVMILMPPDKLDAMLGFLQETFGLSALEVRQVALTFPKLLPWKKAKISNIRSTLKEFLGFDDVELKSIIIAEPKLFVADINRVMATFDYVHNTMFVPHSLIVKWPGILRTRLHIVKTRHLFLVHRDRAQYDPRKEMYVSMKNLVRGTDDSFCENVAKSSSTEYNAFIKTL